MRWSGPPACSCWVVVLLNQMIQWRHWCWLCSCNSQWRWNSSIMQPRFKTWFTEIPPNHVAGSPALKAGMGSYTHDQKQWLKFEHRNSQAKFPAVRITQVLQAGISLRTEAGVWCSSCTCRSSQLRAYRGVGTRLMILSTAGRADNRRSAGRNRCFWLSGVFFTWKLGRGKTRLHTSWSARQLVKWLA